MISRLVQKNKILLTNQQFGAALIFFVFIIAIVATAYALNSLSGTELRLDRDNKTSAAMAEAKAALLAYSSTQDLTGSCTTSCKRPGDLPCPDIDNDGSSNAPCSSQTQRIGRLPWKTLGIADLRDGTGERLWYAVSTNYKNSPRIIPLNSNTLGTISLYDTEGNRLNDGSLTSGLVAVIFSAGSPIKRQDNLSQTRDQTNENIPANYLDIGVGQDNAEFADSSINGFIQGPVIDVNGDTIINDRLVAISREEMIAAMEKRVLAEGLNAFLDYYCGITNVDYVTKTCSSASGNRYFPTPALFNDATCLIAGNLTGCFSNATSILHGRVAANLTPDWSSTSILRSISNGNWFQQNGWRELIHYAVSARCVSGTTNCSGTQTLLTLNNAQHSPEDNKQLIFIATGSSLAGQLRMSTTDKSSEANYLEGQNLTVSDTYVRTTPISNAINDRAVSLP